MSKIQIDWFASVYVAAAAHCLLLHEAWCNVIKIVIS